MFTQSSLLASVFEVVDFVGLLLVGCGVNGLVRLACVPSRAPSTDGTPMFTQSSLLASVFQVVDFLTVGCRGLLSAGCGDLSYGLYCSWPLL